VTTVALGWVDPWLGLAVFAAMVFNGVVWTWIALRIEAGLGVRQNAHRRALAADLVTLTQSLEDILASGHEHTAMDKLSERQRRLDTIETKYGVRQALHAGVSTMVTHLAFGVALFLTLRAAGRGELSAVWIAAISLAVIAAFEAVEALPAAWQFAARTRESSDRVGEITATRPAVADAPDPVAFTLASAPSLEFRNVSFAYDSRTVLDNVSLRIAPCEHVLITGPTGCGKSTLLSLAMRAWDPADGTVALNGIDLRRMPLADLRAATAVLPQHIHVFNTTLRENVRLAKPSATDEDVTQALERAQLGPFLESSLHGLDTILGEFGAAMSAGERQRLGLARILMTDAPLVLADEPTANLDVETERAVLEALVGWACGRTLLMVSHRPIARLAVNRTLSFG
jgi:ABC-type transport system involved in cytochrome bd biosynthesis fused ATPase/permease subunit